MRISRREGLGSLEREGRDGSNSAEDEGRRAEVDRAECTVGATTENARVRSTDGLRGVRARRGSGRSVGRGRRVNNQAIMMVSQLGFVHARKTGCGNIRGASRRGRR